MTTKLSELAARKIAEATRDGDTELVRDNRVLSNWQSEAVVADDGILERVADGVAPIIATQYAPLLDVLRDAWNSRRKITAHHSNVETGNYLHCFICEGESPGGKPFVDDIKHTDDCWVSRAEKIAGEG